jgi:prophage regulatory protein
MIHVRLCMCSAAQRRVSWGSREEFSRGDPLLALRIKNSANAEGETMRLMRLREVQNRVPYGRATIYRKIAAGEFPKPYDMGGGRAVAWLESEIDDWIAARVQARKESEQKTSAATAA